MIAEGAVNGAADKVVSSPFAQNSVTRPLVTDPLLLKVFYFTNLTIVHVRIKMRNFIYSYYANISVIALPVFHY